MTPIGQNYGTNLYALDPQNTATVYLGTTAQGIYKSTDCASTWTHVNTGQNGSLLDKGGNWTIAIDPVDDRIIYANAGYGPDLGLFKSVNAGVDWQSILTTDIKKYLGSGGFVETV